jgi:hypothetical protein
VIDKVDNGVYNIVYLNGLMRGKGEGGAAMHMKRDPVGSSAEMIV